MVGVAGWSTPVCASGGRMGSPDDFVAGTSPGGKDTGRVSPSRHRDASIIAWKEIARQHGTIVLGKLTIKNSSPSKKPSLSTSARLHI